MNDNQRKGIALLGSTGSIGRNTLEVVRRHPGRFSVISLAAGNNAALLKAQAEEFCPEFVSVMDIDAANALKGVLPSGTSIGAGVDGAVRAATFEGVDTVVSAISGAAGLVPTMAAVRAGKDIALANKETLVMAGPLVMDEARRNGVKVLPVDSEHSAIFQALTGHRKEDVRRIILTASGGPFLKTPLEALGSVTPAEALDHPRWKMGRKISIDSATLVNKGLEVIEASFLFGQPASRIAVVVHPQSIVHSMVEYIDGSMVAQMSCPDMKGPIAYALAWPERIEAGTPELKLAGLTLDFQEPDPVRFPCLTLAYDALEAGGTAPAALNAADEVAVERFLSGDIGFTDIYAVISDVLSMHAPAAIGSMEDVVEADRWARETALKSIKSKKFGTQAKTQVK